MDVAVAVAVGDLARDVVRALDQVRDDQHVAQALAAVGAEVARQRRGTGVGAFAAAAAPAQRPRRCRVRRRLGVAPGSIDRAAAHGATGPRKPGRPSCIRPSAASLTNWLVRRSSPKVDIGPWPGTNCVSSPSGHSSCVIEWISVS